MSCSCTNCELVHVRFCVAVVSRQYVITIALISNVRDNLCTKNIIFAVHGQFQRSSSALISSIHLLLYIQFGWYHDCVRNMHITPPAPHTHTITTNICLKKISLLAHAASFSQSSVIVSTLRNLKHKIIG